MDNEVINVQDLQLMAQIIKVVSARGAIQPEEMPAVGTLYGKLAKFIKTAEDNTHAATTEGNTNGQVL